MALPSLVFPTQLPSDLKYTDPAKVFVSLQKLQAIDGEVNQRDSAETPPEP